MPGFPDKFTPFYKRPPGSRVSAFMSRLAGSFVRPLRRTTQLERNREIRWRDRVPSGWAMEYDKTSFAHKVLEFFYDKLQYLGSERPGRQKAVEQYRSGYVTPAEAAYGPDYQVLPEQRAELARRRGAPQRPELQPPAEPPPPKAAGG
jgi:hydrogenase small subunit